MKLLILDISVGFSVFALAVFKHVYHSLCLGGNQITSITIRIKCICWVCDCRCLKPEQAPCLMERAFNQSI